MMGEGLIEHGSDFLYYSQYCKSQYVNTLSPSLVQEIDAQAQDRKAMQETNIQILWTAIMAIISMAASFLVAATIMFNKQLRGHPNMLMALLAIANLGACYSTLIWTIRTNDVVCYFGWAQLLHQSVSLVYKGFTVEDAIKSLTRANMVIYEAF